MCRSGYGSKDLPLEFLSLEPTPPHGIHQPLQKLISRPLNITQLKEYKFLPKSDVYIAFVFLIYERNYKEKLVGHRESEKSHNQVKRAYGGRECIQIL